MRAAILIEVDRRDLDRGDGVAERDGLGQDLGLGLVATPRDGGEQRLGERSGEKPKSGLRVGDVTSGAEKEHQPREIVADLAFRRHHPNIADADDEVRVFADGERDEARNVRGIVLPVPVDREDEVERIPELAVPPLEDFLDACPQRDALPGVHRQPQAG